MNQAFLFGLVSHQGVLLELFFLQEPSKTT